MKCLSISLALAACFGAVLLVAQPSARAQGFVGSERCGKCHEFELQRWRQGPHARAHESLSEKERRDSKCNSCHAQQSGARSVSGRVDLGVGCEQCHGPGRYYQASYVMRDRELVRALGLVDVNGDHCKRCHTEAAPSIEPFDFAAKWARIDHGRAAKQAWLRAQSSAGDQEK